MCYVINLHVIDYVKFRRNNKLNSFTVDVVFSWKKIMLIISPLSRPSRDLTSAKTIYACHKLFTEFVRWKTQYAVYIPYIMGANACVQNR